QKLQLSVSKGLPHSAPAPASRTDEHELVKSVFQVLQGFNTPLLYWDKNVPAYCEKPGTYVSHLSRASLGSVLKPFLFAATCLKRVELFVGKRLWEATLKEEEKSFVSVDRTVTLLALTDSMSSLCSGAEHLYQVVHGAVPDSFWGSGANIASSEVAVHVVNHIFKKLNEVCLVEDGEGEPYHMLLVIFAGTLLPYLQCLDSWLYDGILDDPYEEMFFYANNAVTIDQPAFWEMSYMLRVRGSRSDNSSTLTDSESIRTKESSKQEPSNAGACLKTSNQGYVDILCPVFLKDISRAIVSAGKSFQLVQHAQSTHHNRTNDGTNGFDVDQCFNHSSRQNWPGVLSSDIQNVHLRCEDALTKSAGQFGHDAREMGLLTLSEIFLICLSGLLENGDHVSEYLRRLRAGGAPDIQAFLEYKRDAQGMEEACAENCSEKTWLKLLRDAISGTKYDGMEKNLSEDAVTRDPIFVHGYLQDVSSNAVETPFSPCCYENPAITACGDVLRRNPNSWSDLNISTRFALPPLNDDNMRRTIFGDRQSAGTSTCGDTQPTPSFPRLDGTDFKFGFRLMIWNMFAKRMIEGPSRNFMHFRLFFLVQMKMPHCRGFYLCRKIVHLHQEF
uniref:Gamma-tubulin complex component n=1 Tax=Aegilops tauschii subsp. strangulata TaxID=200361 RepID=A0A453AME0_AEGTS